MTKPYFWDDHAPTWIPSRAAQDTKVKRGTSTNSAMDAIVLIKEVAERMNQSTEDGCVITLCACHGLGARISELAQRHQ